MKVRSLTAGSLLLLVVGCASAPPQEQPNSATLPTNAYVLTMRAPEMFCGGCTAAVESAVAAVPGVLSVQANNSTKMVTVVYDSEVTQSNEIYTHSIFDVYGREFVSDAVYSP